MPKRKGRPAAKTGKDARLTIRLNADEMEMLNYLVARTGAKKSRIVREGIIMRYNLSKNLE